MAAPTQLNSFYNRAVARGEPLIPKHAKTFLEALVSQQEPIQTLQRLRSADKGLSVLQSALFSQNSPEFLNEQATSFLVYLQDPHLKLVQGGDLLQDLLRSIVDPPFFWDALKRAFHAGSLSERGISTFSWLLLELICLPHSEAEKFRRFAADNEVQAQLCAAESRGITCGYSKIKFIIGGDSSAGARQPGESPGWRHDNDGANFKKIAILPTPNELQCSEPPFLRRASEILEIERSARFSTHVDNQFRLLREDMIRELKEEIQTMQSGKGKRKANLIIHDLVMSGVKANGKHPWSLQLRCRGGIPGLPMKKRKAFLEDHKARFLRHESLCCLVADSEQVILAHIDHDEDYLELNPPVICVRFDEDSDLVSVFQTLKRAQRLSLIQLGTAVFAYSPVLRQLQKINWLSLGQELVHSDHATPATDLSPDIEELVHEVGHGDSFDVTAALELSKKTVLDQSQLHCFTAALTQRISLIQGPPGTGKSFIGALIAKAILLNTSNRILVICYTNHALDQFLEDLLAVGISDDDVVRIGSPAKTSPAIQHLNLFSQLRVQARCALDYDRLDQKRTEAARESSRLQWQFSDYNVKQLSLKVLKEHADLDLEHPIFCGAFDIPTQADGMQRVGKDGKVVDQCYLFERWCAGKDGGIFRDITAESPAVWAVANEQRVKAYTRWKNEILEERASSVAAAGHSLNQTLAEISRVYSERTRNHLSRKRIIGCTTTGAAKYVRDIKTCAPEVVLVEEAGEIHEAHVLTALSSDTKQLVLIGDHQQLRPKVHYDLSIAKGEGYDLDVSLFERLVKKGYPHQTLSMQHRMRPQISKLVKELTYDSLSDAPSTKLRPHIGGLQSDLVFLNHTHAEDDAPGVKDMRDPTTGSSKSNAFEAQMTLKCVKYLGQQGYGTDDIVVLTPYLSQLRLLMDVLAKENDPVLNDLDSHDLVRVGLMPTTVSKEHKRRLRISSIDNYQGEQSDIVIISLTRSNSRGDIGFLSSSERLNVLLSRARNGMVLIGNSATFLRSKKGKGVWQNLLDILVRDGRFFDGLPVVCMQHTNRKRLLAKPDDFDEFCPDGGCDEPCNSVLQCGHKCPHKCHRVSDHSSMTCKVVLQEKCLNGHPLSRLCAIASTKTCKVCQRQQKRQQQIIEQARKDQETADAHAANLAFIEDEIRALAVGRSQQVKSQEMEAALKQKRADLEQAKMSYAKQQESARRQQQRKAEASQQQTEKKTGNGLVPDASPSSGATTQPASGPESEWNRQKRVENADNAVLDELMKMTGLVKVKEKFLTIKARIETADRQGIDLKDERLGVVLLGNPGTGKTTVARLYAKFLATIGALPGQQFEETTGARLANDGVSATQKILDGIKKGGGGALFIDEAYQLASGNSFGGSLVLDFLLAEIENLRGTVVFILAGYNRQMEKFFEHNQGFASRIPLSLQFDDYTDQELLIMLERKLQSKYGGKMLVENSVTGLYSRIAIGRVGRGRGHEGFGNARALENLLSAMAERQTERLQRERVAGRQPDDFFLSKEDVIGPDPSKAIISSAAWTELQQLIGLEAVKKSVQGLISRISTNYQRELSEKHILEFSLNRVFIGSPGTGKTSVAKLYGQILKDIGCLSNGEVLVKNPSDFIGSVLGESEKNTRAILESARGKVLIIDEAYMLHTANDAGQSSTDPYKTAVVDTLVAEIQSNPGDDRCVLLLGYREQMEAMFKATNPGLSRRFPLADAFEFADFNKIELSQIFDLKLRKQDLGAKDDAKETAMDVLDKARRRMNFGNGGDVENLIAKAKQSYELRYRSVSASERPVDIIFEPEDFDKNHDRVKNASNNCKELFKDIVGSEDLVAKLEGYTRTAANMRAKEMDPATVIPFNFIFKGPPGTGKTTTARKMGQVFYNMDLLSSSEVIECSATDLVGQYVGQTGPKTTSQLERGLGRVLFIDEAYRLSEGHFATEAVNELVDNLTKEKFAGKLIVILAGYEEAMNNLLDVNQGLASRFPEEVVFQNMAPEHCMTLLSRTIEGSGILIDHDDSLRYHATILSRFSQLSALRAWGNGRDVITLAKSIAAARFRDTEPSELDFSVDYCTIAREVTTFYQSRAARERVPSSKSFRDEPDAPIIQQQDLPPTSRRLEKSALARNHSLESKAMEVTPSSIAEPKLSAQTHDARDPGVSDAIWMQLQKDKALEEAQDLQLDAEIAKRDDEHRQAEALEHALREREELLAAVEAQAQSARVQQELDEAKRLHEQARLKRVAALREKRAAEERKQREVRAQEKLQQMGVCPIGFRWIKQSGGYRCEAGGHFVTYSQLNL